MFANLLKYEFKHSSRILVPVNFGALLISAFGFFVMLAITYLMNLQSFETFLLIGLLYLLWYGLVFAMSLCSTATMIILSVQFYRNKFTDQGYLTFTLPVSTHKILISSLINYVFWSIVTGIISYVGATIMYAPMIIYEMEMLPMISIDMQNVWTTIFSQIGASEVFYIILYIIAIATVFLCAGLAIGILPYFAITLACTLVRKVRLLLAFGIGYVIYMIGYVITIAIPFTEMLVYGILLPELSYPVLVPSLLLLAVLYILFAIGGYFLMHYLTDKKLNL